MGMLPYFFACLLPAANTSIMPPSPKGNWGRSKKKSLQNNEPRHLEGDDSRSVVVFQGEKNSLYLNYITISKNQNKRVDLIIDLV